MGVILAFLSVLLPIKIFIFLVAFLLACAALMNGLLFSIFVILFIYYGNVIRGLSHYFISPDFNFAGAFRNFLIIATIIKIFNISLKHNHLIKERLMKNMFFIIFLMFILWQFISGLFTPYDVMGVFINNLQLYIFPLTLFMYFFLQNSIAPKHIFSFIYVLLLMFIPALIYAGYELYASFNPLQFYLFTIHPGEHELDLLLPNHFDDLSISKSYGQRSIGGLLRPVSVFPHTNDFSFQLNTVLILLWVKYCTEKVRWKKIFIIIYSVVVILFQFMTLSRTGIFQVLLAFIFYVIILSKENPLLKIKIFFLGILCSPALIWGFKFIAMQRSQETISERFYIWNIAINTILSYPIFGIGVGNISKIVGQSMTSVLSFHNSWLDIITVSGILGVIFYGLYLICVTHTIWNKYKLISAPQTEIDKQYLVLYRAFFFLLIIILVNSISEPFRIIYIFIFISSACLSYRRDESVIGAQIK